MVLIFRFLVHFRNLDGRIGTGLFLCHSFICLKNTVQWVRSHHYKLCSSKPYIPMIIKEPALSKVAIHNSFGQNL